MLPAVTYFPLVLFLFEIERYHEFLVFKQFFRVFALLPLFRRTGQESKPESEDHEIARCHNVYLGRDKIASSDLCQTACWFRLEQFFALPAIKTPPSSLNRIVINVNNALLRRRLSFSNSVISVGGVHFTVIRWVSSFVGICGWGTTIASVAGVSLAITGLAWLFAVLVLSTLLPRRLPQSLLLPRDRSIRWLNYFVLRGFCL